MNNRKGFGAVAWLVTLAVLAGAGWAAFKSGVFAGEEAEALLGAKVKRGPMRISVVERGNLKAARNSTLKSEIEGRTTVLYLIEEGTLVEPGDIDTGFNDVMDWGDPAGSVYGERAIAAERVIRESLPKAQSLKGGLSRGPSGPPQSMCLRP